MQHTLRSLMSSDTMEAGLVRLKQTMILLACWSMMLRLPDTQVRRARKFKVDRMFWGQVQRALHRSSISFKCSSPYWKRKHNWSLKTSRSCVYMIHAKALRLTFVYDKVSTGGNNICTCKSQITINHCTSSYCTTNYIHIHVHVKQLSTDYRCTDLILSGPTDPTFGENFC